MNDNSPTSGDVVLDHFDYDTQDGINFHTSSELSDDSQPDMPPETQNAAENDEIRDATEHFEGTSSLSEQNTINGTRKM